MYDTHTHTHTHEPTLSCSDFLTPTFIFLTMSEHCYTMYLCAWRVAYLVERGVDGIQHRLTRTRVLNSTSDYNDKVDNQKGMGRQVAWTPIINALTIHTHTPLIKLL